MKPRKYVWQVMFGLALAWLIAAPARAADSPEDVVRAFNAAITGRDLSKAMPLFAEGGVEFTFRAAHAGMQASTPKNLTSELKAHWSQVGSLLFMVTTRYTRSPTIEQVHTSGDLATVWARIDTETLERNASQPRQEAFDEVYVLTRRSGHWQIAAIADNRGTDRIDVGKSPGS